MNVADGPNGRVRVGMDPVSRPFRGLLLDFYGTLVHEDDEIIPRICEVIRAHATVACDVSPQAIAQCWWDAFAPLCTRSHGAQFVTQREAALASLGATVRQYGAALDLERLIAPQFAHWAAPPLFPDARPFLQSIAQAGIPACVVSNIDRCDLEQALTLHGIDFEHVVTSDDVRAYKPRPEVFAAALTRLGLGPQDVLHVGDSRTSDVAGARSAGIAVAWLNRTGKPLVSGDAPDYIVRDLRDVWTILAGSA